MKTPILDEFIEELQELKDGNFSLTKDLEERLIEFKNIKAAINYTHSCESDSEQLVCDSNELDCPYEFTSRCTMGRCGCKPKAN